MKQGSDAMTDWALKRFWKEANVARRDAGWAIELDGRPVRTPARTPLIVPTAALAEAIAWEWQDQDGQVQPARMSMTRSANSALDKVTPQRDEVVAYIAAYGATDLVCYRADRPDGLMTAQAEAWDPLLDWARSALAAPLVATAGILPVDQPEGSIRALRAEVEQRDAFALTALHDLVMLSGSLIIGLAAQSGVLPAQDLWDRSRIDEHWQEAQWGADAEAMEAAAAKRADFLLAARFGELSKASA